MKNQCCEIKLTKGKVALVDDSDFEYLNQWKWYCQNERYARRSSDDILMHRLILGARKGQICDHVNGNGMDNRRENLRICTMSDNQHNQKIRKNSKSGFKGVSISSRGGYWIGRIGINKKIIYLGIFDTPQEGAKAYNEAAKKYHKDFACLNQI